MNNQTYIYALHGFLGSSKDWDKLKSFFMDKAGIRFSTPNYFDFEFSILDLAAFENDYHQFIGSKNKEVKKVFIGYSLGGRIGLHLLKSNPDYFDHYIFISTNPGMQSNDEKQSRLESDLQWVKKLNEKSWSDFVIEWNQQKVFAGSLIENRSEVDFNKVSLITALDQWSLGRQDNFREVLSNNKNKISWLVGEYDQKFVQIAQDLYAHNTVNDVRIIKNSGHRVIFDSPEELAKLIFTYL